MTRAIFAISPDSDQLPTAPLARGFALPLFAFIISIFIKGNFAANCLKIALERQGVSGNELFTCLQFLILPLDTAFALYKYGLPSISSGLPDPAAGGWF